MIIGSTNAAHARIRIRSFNGAGETIYFKAADLDFSGVSGPVTMPKLYLCNPGESPPGSEKLFLRSTSNIVMAIFEQAAPSATPVEITYIHNNPWTGASSGGAFQSIRLRTDTTDRMLAADWTATWATSTHASRKGRATFNVYDTAIREAIRIEASGSAPMLGFYGTAAVVQAANTVAIDDVLVNVGLRASGGVANFTNDVTVPDEAYGVGWNGSLEVPTKNALYDKIETLGGSGASTALDNLASVAINAALVLGTSDAFALGSATKQWADLFLAEGAVINFDNGDVTVTQAGNTLTVDGGIFNANADIGLRFGGTLHFFNGSDNDEFTLANTGGSGASVATFGGTPTAWAFDADVTVPDEAYGSGWNGDLSVPTKNAVYDKIETLSTPTALTLIPYPNLPVATGAATQTTFSTNTTQSLYQFILPFSITVNKISMKTGGTVTSAGTWDITIYSENGQTQEIAVTTASVSTGDTIITTAVSSVTLSAGVHWFAINPNGTANAQWFCYTQGVNAALGLTAGLLGDVSSEPVIAGTLAISADTPSATFTPTALTENTLNNVGVVFRLDN